VSEEVLERLNEAVELVEKAEAFIGRLKPGEQVSPGVVYQLYETMVLLREKLFEIRLMVLKGRER